jgi:hypothetical protein
MTSRASANLLITALCIGISLLPAAETHAQDQTASASSPASSSRAQKRAERKAARKVARAKKNAQLQNLEQNGGQVTGTNPIAPQSLVTGQLKQNPPPSRKASAPSAASAP